MGARSAECNPRGIGLRTGGPRALRTGALLTLHTPVWGMEGTACRSDSILESLDGS